MPRYDYTTGVPGNNGQIQEMHYYTTPGVEDQTRSEQFTYDGLGRLGAAQTITVNSTSGAKTWSLQWTYDRLGNRLTQSMVAGDPTFLVSQPNFTINPATNQITNSGYTYDGAGNMTHDATAAYAYDGANRLININTTAAVYSYLHRNRIKRVVGSTTMRYIYSGTKVIAEYVGSTTPTLSAEYIYAGSKLLVTVAGSTTTYHHPDYLSNRAETNSSGTRTRTYGHLPFGETWYETTPVDKWKFTTYERDSGTGETGLDYANFRYYASGQGRFMSADFLGGRLSNPQSLNRYSYVLGDPVNLTDPFGLDDCGGPCTDFSYSLGGGCSLNVHFTSETDPDTGETHDMPSFNIICDGGGGAPGIPSPNPGDPGGPGPAPADCSLLSIITPPQAPSGVSVNANIQWVNDRVDETVADPDLNMETVASAWLSKVEPGGGWDYKQSGSQYTSFGNFNFGATCNAMGLGMEACQRGAGGEAYGTATVNVLEGGSWTAGPGNPLGSPAVVNGLPVYGDQTVSSENPSVFVGWIYGQLQQVCKASQ